MPYSYYEMTDKLNDAFAAYAAEADYISSFRASVKPVVLSVPMTYTHISGVYTFFTGEANVNVNFPDFWHAIYDSSRDVASARNRTGG